MTIFPDLDSERLRMRPVSIDDLANVHSLLTLAETDRFNALGIPSDIEHTRQILTGWIELMQLQPPLEQTFVIELPHSTFIGLFGLKLAPQKYSRAELWYKLHADHWGHGYATEAVRRMLSCCFNDLDLHRVEAGVAVGNAASIRVLEKCGLQREGRRRENLPLATGFSDSFCYGLLRSDYELLIPD